MTMSITNTLARSLCFVSLAACLTGLGCASSGPYVWANDLPAPQVSAEPIIQPRDTLLVDVRNQTALSGEFVVRDDGHYLQPTVGSIHVEGLVPSSAATLVAGLLKGVVIDPRVSIWVSKPAPIRVNVVGEVKTPGIFELTRDRSVLGALTAAGWINEFANRNAIFVVRPSERQRIRFRVSDLTSMPDGPSARFRLHDGDAVVVE